MSAPTCRAPHGLGFVRIQLEPIRLRPVSDVVDAAGDLRRKRIDGRRRT